MTAGRGFQTSKARDDFGRLRCVTPARTWPVVDMSPRHVARSTGPAWHEVHVQMRHVEPYAQHVHVLCSSSLECSGPPRDGDAHGCRLCGAEAGEPGYVPLGSDEQVPHVDVKGRC
jgi:hypothetical protein